MVSGELESSLRVGQISPFSSHGPTRRGAQKPEIAAPGQYVTEDFPVLSAGPTPHTPLERWTFSITQGGQTRKSWTWQEFQALPAETITTDIHCVTRWSKLDNVWEGVPIRAILDRVKPRPEAAFVLQHADLRKPLA